MDIDDAVQAVKFLKPKLVIPMHYQTFDLIDKDPAEFAKKLRGSGIKVKILEFGESYNLN